MSGRLGIILLLDRLGVKGSGASRVLLISITDDVIRPGRCHDEQGAAAPLGHPR
ncbi:hypothetical protein Desca_1643 [Desulfotomaculum nigrificans CO-1-SRB]|uniref:Uncharacterized protein n=1 Tax=Desulfotomaculum nigrificans (strain DSM 14880 / VKM B-2319 / CO-1-SRB) TaxID=868595 RepID=F6B766_DESCC|nr:hypothetical protein Desca_1643 [Desulfotomaculum nigrificans CO-1-SRB]SHH44612.1 hypothetical protein SAMN02745177_02579 [Desulforamulus hydrothermalis Lam5 = DSM 18033]